MATDKNDNNPILHANIGSLSANTCDDKYKTIELIDTTHNKTTSTSFKLNDQQIDAMMEIVDDVTSFDQSKAASTDNAQTGENENDATRTKITETGLDHGITSKMKNINDIGSYLIYTIPFCFRICILILTMILILLSISYTFGTISSTELVLINYCPGYDITTIWEHSLSIESEIGELTHESCWTTSTLSIDDTSAFHKDTYEYKSIYDSFSIFQCVIFSLFTCYCVTTFIYGAYAFIIDIKAIRKQTLYKTAPEFKRYLKKLNNNPVVDNDNEKSQKTKGKIVSWFGEWKKKYEEYFADDTTLSVFRMIIMELWEIILQTFALLLYNGYNLWAPNSVHLSYKVEYIYLFCGVLSFNCLIVGVMWLFYVFKQDSCNGFIFKLFSFCVDQFCDLFYALFPFIVVFTDPHTDTSSSKHPIWIAFGLLNTSTPSAFIYAAFPMLLLCTKCLLMARKAIRGMRNKSYAVWLSNNQTQNTDNIKLGVPVKTKTCFSFIASIAVLFIVYSVVLCGLVINHLTTAVEYCANAADQIDIVEMHPELFVYDEYCFYKVYPFASMSTNNIAHNCECRVFQIHWADVNISDEYKNINITKISIIDAILTQWTMLEKFRSIGFSLSNDNGNQSSFMDVQHDEYSRNETSLTKLAFTFKSTHFGATEMKFFVWNGIDIISIDEAISNWRQLELFNVQRINTFYELPSSFSKLTKLKAFRSLFVYNMGFDLKILCNLTELILIVIRFGKITKLPHCITKLDKLQRLFIYTTGLPSFPLALLNMTNLKELDLWDNAINYEELLQFNDISKGTDPFQYYSVNADLKIFLNSNPICSEYRYNKVPETFQLWVEEHGTCLYLNCSEQGHIGGCSPSGLQNGFCDISCNTTECYMDGGDCSQLCFTQTDCTYDQFSNDICDEECNNRECYWDNKNCLNDTLLPDMPKPTKGPPDWNLNGTMPPGGKGLNDTMPPGGKGLP